MLFTQLINAAWFPNKMMSYDCGSFLSQSRGRKWLLGEWCHCHNAKRNEHPALRTKSIFLRYHMTASLLQQMGLQCFTQKSGILSLITDDVLWYLFLLISVLQKNMTVEKRNITGRIPKAKNTLLSQERKKFQYHMTLPFLQRTWRIHSLQNKWRLQSLQKDDVIW